MPLHLQMARSRLPASVAQSNPQPMPAQPRVGGPLRAPARTPASAGLPMQQRRTQLAACSIHQAAPPSSRQAAPSGAAPAPAAVAATPAAPAAAAAAAAAGAAAPTSAAAVPGEVLPAEAAPPTAAVAGAPPRAGMLQPVQNLRVIWAGRQGGFLALSAPCLLRTRAPMAGPPLLLPLHLAPRRQRALSASLWRQAPPACTAPTCAWRPLRRHGARRCGVGAAWGIHSRQ